MSFVSKSLISDYEIPEVFLTSEGKCVLESVVEKYFNNKIMEINPNIEIQKESMGRGITDGIIRFYNNQKELQFWILQECKRDEGPTIVHSGRAFLQSMMYLGSVFFDYNIITHIDKFKGIFLDSARYFTYIPKDEIYKILESFEPLYKKYNQLISPHNAYEADALDDWAIQTFTKLKKYVYKLDDDFKLDDIIKDLYENKI